MEKQILKFQENDLKIEGTEATLREFVSAIKDMDDTSDIELPKTISDIIAQMDAALSTDDLGCEEDDDEKPEIELADIFPEYIGCKEIKKGFINFDENYFCNIFNKFNDCSYFRADKSNYDDRLICFDLKINNLKLEETLEEYESQIIVSIGNMVEDIIKNPGYQGSHYTIVPVGIQFKNNILTDDIGTIFSKIKDILDKDV